MNATNSMLETIRMLFELDRADDPQLYDDLIRFKKGTKRINRLRLLAHEAVLGQIGLLTGAAIAKQGVGRVSASAAADGQVAGDFEMPVAADVFATPLDT